MNQNYCGDSARSVWADSDEAGSPGGTRSRFDGFGAQVVVIAALVVMVMAVLLFAVLLDDVARSSGLAMSDLTRVRDLAGLRGPTSMGLMRVVTTAGSPVAMCVLAAAVCGWLAWRQRNAEPVVVGVVGTSGIAMLDTATKYMVGRPRPPMSLHAVIADGYSFPSGHASFSAVVVPLCCALITRWVVSGAWWRAALWLCSVVTVVAVGFSRVFLGAHYPTDVLSGWCLAGAWDALMVLAVVLIPGRRPGGLVGIRVRRQATGGAVRVRGQSR